MAEKNKKPEIRFTGFTDAWKQRKYSETFTKIPNNTLSRAELNYNSGLAKNVHYGDVLIKFGELLDIEKDEIPYITDGALVNKFRSSKLQSGDVIIADAAEDETVGKCTELVNVGEETVVSGLHTIPSRPTLSFVSGYLGYFMNSPAYHTQLLRLMQGTKVTSISKAALQDTAIFYPIDSVEQCKISKLFQQLNNLITLHQRKYDKLVTVKKSMLEKMFPKDGANVPEIRFAGFTGAWEQRNLSELVTPVVREVPKPTEPYEKISVRSHAKGTFHQKIENPDAVAMDKLFVVRENDLIVNITFAWEHAIAVATKEDDGLLVSHRFPTYTMSNSDVGFMKYVVSQENFRRKMELISPGGAGRNRVLDKKDFLNIEVIAPIEIDEQNRIGVVFMNLDHLITLHQRELEKLKNIKRSMLERMFV